MERNEEILKFATEAHGEQTRKYTGLPYITHPVSVAERVRLEGGDLNQQAAALLHDVLEDTQVTHAQLRAFLFRTCFQEDAEDILTLVVELTDVYTKSDFPHLNRKDRKALEASRFKWCSDRAKAIKREDIKDNTASIVEHDPDFAKVYLEEVGYLLLKMI